MKEFLALSLVTSFLVSVAGCENQAREEAETMEPAASTEADLAALIDQWESSFNDGDFEATTTLYTTDAVRYPPGAPPQNGREAILADLPNYSEFTIDLEVVGSKMAGDVISAWGTYALHARSGESEGPVQDGPWMNVVVRGEDDSWRIYRDIWNLRQQP